jgi:hypothetical protein
MMLLAEDGATLRACLQNLPDGRFQAVCMAQHDRGPMVDDETPEYHISDTEEGARNWVRGRAMARGFGKVRWDRR